MLIFDEEQHKYYIELPSVSEICNRILGQGYDGIPEEILRKAAEFGTKVHEAIELYNDTGLIASDIDDKQAKCLSEYIELSKNIKPLKSELMVKYETYYAGTLDLIAEEEGEVILIDHKTTSTYHKERVELQLSLYRLSYGWDKISKIKCMWLPKTKKGKLIDVESWDKEELIKKVIEVAEKN